MKKTTIPWIIVIVLCITILYLLSDNPEQEPVEVYNHSYCYWWCNGTNAPWVIENTESAPEQWIGMCNLHCRKELLCG